MPFLPHHDLHERIILSQQAFMCLYPNHWLSPSPLALSLYPTSSIQVLANRLTVRLTGADYAQNVQSIRLYLMWCIFWGFRLAWTKSYRSVLENHNSRRVLTIRTQEEVLHVNDSYNCLAEEEMCPITPGMFHDANSLLSMYPNILDEAILFNQDWSS